MSDTESEQPPHPLPTIKNSGRRSPRRLMILLFCCILVGVIAYEYRESRLARLSAPLYIAVKNNQVSEVDRLLAQGANPNRISFHKETVEASNGATDDAWDRFVEQCHDLLDRLKGTRRNGGGPDAPDVANEPCLLIAVENNNQPILQALLEAGANPNTSAGGTGSVLSLATRQADPEIVRELIRKGAIVNPRGGAKDLTPLQCALRRGDSESLQLLLEAGAQTDVVDEQGRTPLMQAVAMEDPALVKTLLAHNAAVNARNKFGLTALKIARMDGQEEIEQALERAGATE